MTYLPHWPIWGRVFFPPLPSCLPPTLNHALAPQVILVGESQDCGNALDVLAMAASWADEKGASAVTIYDSVGELLPSSAPFLSLP